MLLHPLFLSPSKSVPASFKEHTRTDASVIRLVLGNGLAIPIRLQSVQLARLGSWEGRPIVSPELNSLLGAMV